MLNHLHDGVVHHAGEVLTTAGEPSTTAGEPSTTGAEVTTTGGEAMMTEDVTFLQHLHQILVMSQIVQPVLCLHFAYDVSLDSQWAVASSPGAAAFCRAPVAKLAERIATDVIQLVLAAAIRLVVRPPLPMSMELAKPAVLSATAATVLDQEIVMMEDVSLAMEKTGLVAVGLAHLTAVAVTSLELKTATQENVILRTPTMDTTALRAAHSVRLAI